MKKRILALAAAMLLFCSVGLVAQTSTTGQVAGTVLDPTGALVPGAKMVLTSDAGTQRTVTSDSSGHYSFPLLPPGRYSLEVIATGFAAANFLGVTANITETTTLDVSLKVKSATGENIEVTAAPPLVQSENATQGRVIQQETIRQLPLPTRNFQQLLTLTPGTTGSLQNSSELGRGDAVISVNGQRTTSNSVVINGMDAAAIGTGGTPNLAVPASDSLQEFIVQTSLYDASTGRSTGGVVAAVTKSGTNQWHGNVYEFLRNKSLNANNFFLKRQQTDRPDYKRNQFGGTLGGPIAKDKFFVFLSYQGTRETNGTSLTNSLSTVSVPGCLTNDRSSTALVKLTATVANGGCGMGLLGALLPNGYFDPVALKIFQAQLPNGQYLIPSPKTPTATAAPVPVTVSTISKCQEDQFNFNLDYKLSQNNTVTGKFFWADNPTTQGLYSFAGVQNALQAPGADTQVNLKNRVLSVGDMWVISPTMINDFRAGGNVITVDSIPDQPFTSAEWGVTNPLGFTGAPTITVTNSIDLNASPLASNFSQNKTYTFADTLTWTKGKHTLKFGGEYKRQFINLRFDAYNNGQIYYSNYAYMVSGYPLLSILGSGDPYRDIRANDYNLFVQDDWHVSKRLTVNAGLRWDVYGAFTEEKGRFVAFDPRLAETTPILGGLGVAVTGGFVQAGNGKLPDLPKVQNGLVDTPYKNFGPRVGFAFRPNPDNDTVVIRGGYGIYFDRLNARSFNSQVFNPPYDLVGLNITTAAGIDPAHPYVNVPAPSAFPTLFNDPTVFPFGGPPYVLQVPIKKVPTLADPTTYQYVYSPVPVNGIYPDRSNFVTPYVQQYNVGVQWEAIKNTLLDISYVGSMSHKLTRLVNINQATLPAAATAPYTGPYAFGLSGLASAPLGTFVQQTSAQAGYNSLQASVTKRYSNGLQLLASYTWSHSIDDFSGGAVNDLTGVIGDTHKNYFGSSDFDRRHRFVVSWVYDLPRTYRGGAAFPKQVLNNWQLAGVGTWQSGIPFSIIGTASAFNAIYADFVSGQTVDSATKSGDVGARLNSYFNTAAFTLPPATGTGWGNVPRNAFVGPGQKNLDLSIVKFFPIHEKQKIEFRSEFFNVFNHTNFANPVNIFASAQFGQILSTSTGPRVIQFAFKYSF